MVGKKCKIRKTRIFLYINFEMHCACEGALAVPVTTGEGELLCRNLSHHVILCHRNRFIIMVLYINLA